MRDYFHYQKNDLWVEETSVETIAQQYGTPCYIYSQSAITEQYQQFEKSLGNFPHRICYAVKANSNLSILKTLAELGAGFDIVSVGELERVLKAGGKPNRIVFSGVGKTASEIERALSVDIACFNVESLPELERIEQIAQKMNKKAPVSLRVNPDVVAGTHPYIATGHKENKFGIDINQIMELYRMIHASSHLQAIGIAFHIGSQILDLSPFLQALDAVLYWVDQLEKEGIVLQHIDVGGGLGVRYENEQPPTLTDYVEAILEKLTDRCLTIWLEPGRALVANAGILLTRVEYIKKSHSKYFAIVDAGMNDLLRPALYEAWQEVVPVKKQEDRVSQIYDVVGPVCESGDFIGLDRPLKIEPGDWLAVKSAGAYGFAMSSNYNTRPRAAEVMVEGTQVRLIRRRETIEELLALEWE